MRSGGQLLLFDDQMVLRLGPSRLVSVGFRGFEEKKTDLTASKGCSFTRFGILGSSED